MCVLIKNEAIDVDEYYTTANNGVALTAPLMARNQKLLDCHCYLYSSKKIVLQVVVNDLELFQLFFARLYNSV